MVENIKSQMRKGILEYCILTIISKKEVYTSEILDTLKDANLVVVEGTVYPLLTRMKNNGVLTYSWRESKAGPPRKYFTLTTEGNQLLQDLNREWGEINQAILKILKQ